MVGHQKQSCINYFILTIVGILLSQSALSIHLGLAAAEEGDNRLRPATQLEIDLGKKVFSQTTLYGRKYKTVLERSVIQSFVFRSSPSQRFKSIYVDAGPSLLWDYTQIEKSKGEQLAESRFNVGVNLGLLAEWRLSKITFFVFAHSHLFPAGQAALYMVTGRRQTIGFGFGF